MMEDAKRKTEFSYGGKLPLRIHPEALEYGVMITIFNGNRRDTIRYEVSIKWNEKDNLHSLVFIDRITPVYVNDMEPDYIADELALLVSETLYPLVLFIDSDGSIAGIGNYEEIMHRWLRKKERILEYYTGKWMEKYLKLNDNIFQTRGNLENSLKNDWFLYAFFNRIYCAYSGNLQIRQLESFPFFQKRREVDYQVTRTIDEYIDKQGYITIEMLGDLADERSKTDLEQAVNFPSRIDSEKATGKYRGKYLLESKHHTIDALMLDCSLDLEEKRRVSIVVSRIRKGDDSLMPEAVPQKKETMFSRFNKWLNDPVN